MGPRVSLGRGTGGGDCTQQYWLCCPSSPGKALDEVCVGLAGAGGALCQPPLSPSSHSQPEVDGAGPLVGRHQVTLLLVLPPLLEPLDNGMPKAERRVPDCAGTALDLCRGLSRGASQEQLDAADPLVMQRMLSDSLCPALHALTLKGCTLLPWGGEGPSPCCCCAHLPPCAGISRLDEPRYLSTSPKKHCD